MKRKKTALRVGFDRSLKLDFHGSRVTIDAGLSAYRELDEAFGLTTTADAGFQDWRIAQKVRYHVDSAYCFGHAGSNPSAVVAGGSIWEISARMSRDSGTARQRKKEDEG